MDGGGYTNLHNSDSSSISRLSSGKNDKVSISCSLQSLTAKSPHTIISLATYLPWVKNIKTLERLLGWIKWLHQDKKCLHTPTPVSKVALTKELVYPEKLSNKINEKAPGMQANLKFLNQKQQILWDFSR